MASSHVMGSGPTSVLELNPGWVDGAGKKSPAIVINDLDLIREVWIFMDFQDNSPRPGWDLVLGDPRGYANHVEGH